MRILQVIDTLEVGGAEKVYVTMCNILLEKKVDVSSLFLLLGGPLKDNLHPKIPIIELKRINKWSVRKLIVCAKIIRQYDIIHCHLKHVYRYISIVNKIFLLNKKIILQDHGSVNIDKKVPFLFTSLLKPKYYIGVSTVLCEWANQKLKIEKENVFLLENIIIKTDIYNYSSKEFDWILVSNIKKVKNILFAVQLAKSYQKKLLIVGKIQDDKIFSEIKNSIDNDLIKIETQIDEVQPVLRKAKVGIHTSLSETGPLVLIEYLAQGLPFLAYETGEVAKILKPYFPEYFIDNFNIDDWKTRLELIMNSVPDTQKMEEVFEQYFGEKQYYKKLVNIYKCTNV